MKKTALLLAAAVMCTMASCSSTSDKKDKNSSPKEETTVVTTTAEEETTVTTTAKVTTTAEVTTTAVTTTTDPAEEEEKKKLMAEVPQEAVDRAAKYLSCSVSMDYVGVMKSMYPKEIDEMLEANGNYEGIRTMFGEGDPDAEGLECELKGASKLDADIIKDTQTFLTGLDNEEPKSPVEHTVTDGYLLTLACKDKSTGEKFTEDVGVVLVNGSEWVVTVMVEE